jgi:hypothetical protein
MKTSLAALLSAVLAITGCATASKDIAPVSVSPLLYESYGCDQLSAELARVHARSVQLGGRLDQAASNDAALTTAGMILFWPALFFLGGTRQQEAEYARLKGEADAIQQAAIGKRCKLQVSSTPDSAPEGQSGTAAPTASTGAAPVKP